MADPTTNVKTVTTTAVSSLAQASSTRSHLVVRNTDATNPVFLGGSTVAASGANQGVALPALSTLILDNYHAPLYAIASGASVSVQVLEAMA